MLIVISFESKFIKILNLLGGRLAKWVTDSEIVVVSQLMYHFRLSIEYSLLCYRSLVIPLLA